MKIALVLCQTLGDVVLIHNIVDGIYKKFDNPEIDVFINESYKSIVEFNPKIKNVKTSVNWLLNWNDIIQEMVNDYYDEFLIPQQLHTEDNVWHQIEHLRHQHLVDLYLSKCHLPPREETETLKMFCTEHDEEVVNRILNVNSLDNFLLVHTTSRVDSKDWDYFGELCQELLNTSKIQICQVGLPSDKDLTNVDFSTENSLYDLRGQLTIPQFYALCRKSKCFIGLDSGLSYIAASSNTSCIVLQGATIPKTSGPWGKNVINILSDTLSKCKIRCHSNCKYPKEVNGKCINNIKVDRVLNEVRRILDEKS